MGPLSFADPVTPLQQAAIEYLQAGLHILALSGKRPNGRVHGDTWSWEDSFHGVPTESEWPLVMTAFSEHERGTTGIAILIPEDFYVADVDSDRAAALLLKLGYVADEGSISAKTKNGLHIWFWWPGANSNRWIGDGFQPEPTRTLLFKGLGGYVVAPPSLHHDDAGTVDGVYQWGPSPLVSDGRRFMPDVLPEGVRERFEAEDQFTANQPPKEKMTHFNMVPNGKDWWLWDIEMSYALEGLEKAIENAADGNQNNVIHWAAMTAREEGVPYEVSMDRLLTAAIKGGHPRNRARDTIKGAYKRALRA